MISKSSGKKELYIIDGHALAYKSYYAMIKNPLVNSKGLPTGAVYGFANSILNLFSKYECPYSCVVFDSSEPGFRYDMYADYKANRKEMPDDMKLQLPYIFDLVEKMRIPVFVKDGVEADDVIAVLAKKAANEGFLVYIVSNDKDLMQLVSERISMLSTDPKKGGLKQITAEDVEKKMGVTPRKILDLLALMGDSSDNVPGLPGVGPKTAIKMLQKAGSVKNILEDPSCLENEKLEKKVKENRDKLLMSLDLVTLKEDVGLDVDISGLSVQEHDKKEVIALFKELEFRTLLRNPVFKNVNKPDFRYNTVTTINELEGVLKKISERGIVSIDTETTSTMPRKAVLVGISAAVDRDEAWYIPVGHENTSSNLPIKEVIEKIKPVIESDKIKKTGQNLKYDYQIFRSQGCLMRGIFFDTMIASYLLQPGGRQHNMGMLAWRWLEIDTRPIEELIGKGNDQISFAEVPLEKAVPYACEDAIIPLMLMDRLEPALKEKNLLPLFNDIEIPLIPILAEMEWRGTCLDVEYLDGLSREYSERLEKISEKIFKMSGEEFNLNSPKQVGEIFFNKLGMPRSKKTKTGYSTNEAALTKLAYDYPVAKKLLEHREVQKLLSTYINVLPQQVIGSTSRLHTSFNQAITTTGRLSSTEPNLQNIPVRSEAGRRIREAFTADKGFVLVSADYSQIELRLLAHISQDRKLKEAFITGMDIHTKTASAVYGVMEEMVNREMRNSAKAINFGLMYGMGPNKLSREIGVSFREAQAFIETYFEQFPEIRNFMEKVKKETAQNGYCETLFGRRRYLPDINSSNRRVREAAERAAVNTPVQGSAADIIKIAMIEINREIRNKFPDAGMLLQVHDELIFEVPEEECEDFKKWVVEKMESAAELSVPLKVDTGYGKNWLEAH